MIKLKSVLSEEIRRKYKGFGIDKPVITGMIAENTLLMEASQDEAALDFLKEKVRNGPFRGNVYLAGGAVRDMIRGEIPKDLDVVVTNFGMNGGMDFAIWLAKEMGNYKHESNPVLASKFGTAKLLLTGFHNGVDLSGYPVESVFARKEVYTPGSRKPQVFPGTIEDDAFRRDFTVNSLMMDLTTDKILDITGKGKADIAAGLIRTTNNPDEIFGQDALRMFRAIRFATKYKWKIDPPTWEGIKNNLSNLDNASYERVRDELDKILMTKDPAYGIRLLRDVGLLSHVSPDLQKAVGMTQNKHHKHDVFDHTMDVLSKTNPVLIQRLMALFHDIGKVATRSETPTGVHFIGHEDVGADMVDQIMRKLKYPLELIDAVKTGVKHHMRLKHGGDAAVISNKVLRKFKLALGDTLEDVLDVIHADNISHADASAMPNQIAKVRELLKGLNITVTKPNLPINGDDLLAMGIPRGKKVGEILNAVTDAWYSNPDITRDEAIAIAKSMMYTKYIVLVYVPIFIFMIKICYTWTKAEILWKDANWTWAECRLIDEIVTSFGNPPGVPGEWAQPNWLQDDKPHDPYEKEKRKRFIHLLCKIKNEKYDEKKLVKDNIKIKLTDVKLVVESVKGINIQIIEE